MSAGFESTVILSLIHISSPISSSSSPSSSSLKSCLLNALHFCCNKQRLVLETPSLSMRLRPKRTCSSVEVFGGFHIKQQKFSFFIVR
ncbi:hypothetical protein ISN45_At01g059160 [Arabidopsis thaliana x Arabidopsis arenosa]|uniref:Uncharacterized protein n=2 Tax=Arabidopsis TaxID=3701 RepID=A0A8T2HH60_ARASU|nr:hypothetical protein ISN45_At01g059160 [Arabidopsis thaliana x Arabidopsis arenosa]KAG7658873.1 hypothetical protein ISN44_As01g058180 [Arabidopsis suecica]